jgi:hypothetical protein
VIPALKRSALLLALAGFFGTASAQDARELLYNFEILNPSHADKPSVEGWASERIAERLDRGVSAFADGGGNVYVSWRLLGSDPADVGFDVYREVGGRQTKLTAQPVTATTGFTDKNAARRAGARYWVVPVVNGAAGEPSAKITAAARRPDGEPAYISVPLQPGVVPNGRRLGIADLNGDGQFDFVLLQGEGSKDPGSREASQNTYTVEAYLHDGTFLWRNDLGDGIEPGNWYSPFVVYDLDGDGKAEVALKTAPTGLRQADGRVYDGPEWLSIWDGMTGREVARGDWTPRNARFGDHARVNRNQLGVAYLDGKTPCLIVARGTYKAMTAEAWTYRDGQLTKLWSWDGDEENPVVRSQGAHTMLTCDVDADGRDEVLLGSAVLDDNGTLLWSAGVGHTDKVIVTDVDPARPGLEVFFGSEVIHEDGRGISLRDAATGETIWSVGTPTIHVREGMAADVDPSRPGLELLAAEDPKGHQSMRIVGNDNRYLFDARGNLFATGDQVPLINQSENDDWLWWGAGKLRAQLIEPEGEGPVVRQYGRGELQRGFRGRVAATLDLTGDWREEIITVLPGELRIYGTTIPATDRRVTLLEDNTYRQVITSRTMGAQPQQVPTPAYYLGE